MQWKVTENRTTSLGEDGAVSRVKTGSFVDFIPDAARRGAGAQGAERPRAAIDAARDLAQARRTAEAESRDAEEATVKDLLGPTSTIAASDIARNDKLLPTTRLHTLALAERVTQPNPRAQVSHATALRLLADIRRRDGDPQRIADTGPIYDAYTSGQLNRADFEWTRKEFAQAATPDGAMFAQLKETLFDRVAHQIDDPESFYQFQHLADRSRRLAFWARRASRGSSHSGGNLCRRGSAQPYVVHRPLADYRPRC